ncbi:TonB-dependent receptor [Nitrosomonas europaea]|nr:TonB-dependent receptor [Nitrosomonas europaea]
MPTTTLAPVVVQATRLGASIADTPASVDVIDGRQLRARQPGINLSEGLVSVPGL